MVGSESKLVFSEYVVSVQMVHKLAAYNMLTYKGCQGNGPIVFRVSSFACFVHWCYTSLLPDSWKQSRLLAKVGKGGLTLVPSP